ncbi:MAG: 3-isopropylmalate dehydrogenase [Clostridiales bacterium]|jgi:3-isopropylmalate dehydrogenase|nr:3-isopropylmalate dehydrogenase [Clostridiales bacterium]
MSFRIALIKGDGIGPEVVDSARAVLDKTAKVFGRTFDYEEALAGGCAIDAVGEPLPSESVRICKSCDAVLLGAVGGTKWDNLPVNIRPEKAILGLRSELGLFANLRPALLHKALAPFSPLRGDIADKGIDLMFVRELTGGIYFGERGVTRGAGGKAAFDTEMYSEAEIERIGRKAFELAMGRRKDVVSIDKANVLESSRLWRETMRRIAAEYPSVKYSEMLVDNAAMQLVINPSRFDVVVTSNLFGDILSDEAAAVTGSIGLIPSASVGEGSFGLYEPIHGSAPDIAGSGKANPTAAILSAAMMLRCSMSLCEEADRIEEAVEKALMSGARTSDMVCADSEKALSTKGMTEAVLSFI